MTKLPCKRSQIEFIVWKDAVSDWTRASVDAAAELSLATNINVGWVVHQNEERLVLSNGTSSSGEMDHLVIPVANVVERIRLRGKCQPAACAPPGKA